MGKIVNPWGDAEKAEVKRRWLNGESAGEIAAAMGNGRTRNAVIAACDRMGLVGDKAKGERAIKPKPVEAPKEPGKPGRPRIHAVSERSHVPKPRAAARVGSGRGQPLAATRSFTAGGSSREQLRQMRPGPKQFHFGEPTPLSAGGEAKPPVDVDRMCQVEDGRPVVSLMDLGPNACKWPMGDPLQPGFGFCGQFAEDGKPYCTAHRHRAYTASLPPMAPLRQRVGASARRTSFDLATSL